MLNICRREGIPAILLNGSSVLQQRDAAYFSIHNPYFKKMGSVKTNFVRDLLEANINPVLSDIDVVWLKVSPDPRACFASRYLRTVLERSAAAGLVLDPRNYFHTGSLASADILISTDCIDIPADRRDNVRALHDRSSSPSCSLHIWRLRLRRVLCACQGGCAHVNLNTGILYLRATENSKSFVKKWNEKITSSNVKWMRDQPAFNTLIRESDDLSAAWRSPKAQPRKVLSLMNNTLHMAMLPGWLFASGHIMFVQEHYKHEGTAHV
eukprot:scaffold626_cov409-Prasinococcus_capsulatus_cf.AAC.24